MSIEFFNLPEASLELWGNTLYSYGIAVGIFIVIFIVLKLVQWVLLYRLVQLAEKTTTDIDDILIKIVKSLRPPFYYFIAFYIATKFLTLTPFVAKVIDGIIIAWIVYQVVIGIQILIDCVIERRISKEDGSGENILHLLGRIGKWILWPVGILLVLSNLGVNITSLVAGLGIGGIAIALALQNILNDLFSSFSIYFDKPFEVGDFIVVGSNMGTVQKIGIKTTRIKALQGEEIVISNQELTSARVQNFKKLEERRVTFSFGVLYETKPVVLKKIPDMVGSIFKTVKETRLDRVHFLSFGDSSLDFEVVYYVLSGDYNEYADKQQEINLKLVEMFEKENISFAYPTRTVYLAK
jgi:small-conductance mechanosensitive channel